MSIAIIGFVLFALLVAIGVIIVLAMYFTKKSKTEDDDETPEDEKKPELTFNADATKTINPQEEDDGNQEGYAIEYAGGEFIDLTLSWTNGQGFEGVVDKLIFTRYVGGTKIQGDKETEKADEIADYGSGSVTFSGSDVSEGVDTKGVNVIKAYYNEMKPENLLATAEVEVTDDDFDQVMTGEFKTIDIPVAIKGDTFKLEKTVKKTYYNIHWFPEWFTIKQSGDVYTFIKSGGDPLVLSDNVSFKIQTYKDGGKILIRADNGQVYVHDLPEKPGTARYYSVDEMNRELWTNAQFTLKSKMSSTWPDDSPGKVEATASKSCNLAAARVCGDAVGKATEDAVFCCRNNNCDDDCQW